MNLQIKSTVSTLGSGCRGFCFYGECLSKSGWRFYSGFFKTLGLVWVKSALEFVPYTVETRDLIIGNHSTSIFVEWTNILLKVALVKNLKLKFNEVVCWFVF